MVAEASQTGRFRHTFLIIVMMFSATVEAQFYETIRSSQSIGATTVGSDIFQIQSGIDLFGFERPSDGVRGSGLLTNTALRFGLTNDFEVAGFLEYRSEEVAINNTSSLRYGISNATIGLRHQISVGDGLLPGVGFQFRLRLPVANEYYPIDNVAPSLFLSPVSNGMGLR